jgi:WD40 repeat protein
MTRFLAVCVLVVGGSVAAVALLGQMVWDAPKSNGREPGSKVTEKSRPSDKPSLVFDEEKPAKPAAPVVADDKPVRIQEVAIVAGGPQPLVIQEGRVLSMEHQDVPAEHDGKLLFLAREAHPGEIIPEHKLVEYEVNLLAVRVSSWAGVPEKDRIQDDKGHYYRRWLPGDELAPGTTALVRQKLRFRKLDIGDRVRKDQQLGVINPELALEEVGTKQAKLEAADADVRGAMAYKEEAIIKLAAIVDVRNKVKNGVSREEYGAAKAQAEKYKEEEIAKRAGVVQAQRELSASLTQLRQHMIRASINGVIKTVYKQPGEAVKNLDAVLQIHNPDLLRVEAQVEVQDALPLRERLERARKLREDADRLRAAAWAKREAPPAAAQRLDQEANQLVAVQVEASRVEPPLAALSGHRQEVTCVAVTSETVPRIVSGSEDHTVRIWERQPGASRWQERVQLDHHAIVRSLACSPKGDLLLTGTATGRARLFDLKNLKSSERFLQGRHSGSINAVAFSPDGTMCVTGGEDRSICLWETAEGALLGKVSSAHGQGVTSLTFTSKGQVVSAGRDKRLVVWNLVEGEGGKTLEKAAGYDRRSGDVAQLGVDPSGEHVLFDEGRELKVLSPFTGKIEGTLQNPSATGAFSTLALFSPDGNTILTNGNGAGRLQLWRTPTAKARAAELRQYTWSNGGVTCGAFSSDSKLAVTGTQDARVLVWRMPDKMESETSSTGELTYVEEFLDTSLKRLTVRATVKNPGWIIVGSNATIVVPPLLSR